MKKAKINMKARKPSRVNSNLLADDILSYKRSFFICHVKNPLRLSIIKLTSGKLSWIGAIIALVKIVTLIRKFPEPTHKNVQHPNTHVLIDLWDLFFKYEDLPCRDFLFRAIRKLFLCEYEHDDYYRNRIDWFIEKLVEKHLNKEWVPRKPWKPTGNWNEPAVLEAIKALKISLLKSARLPTDTPIKAFDKLVDKIE